MTQHPNDLDAVRHALTPIEDSARGLRWAEERPWTVQSHVWDDVGVVTIDLHDLNDFHHIKVGLHLHLKQ